MRSQANLSTAPREMPPALLRTTGRMPSPRPRPKWFPALASHPAATVAARTATRVAIRVVTTQPAPSQGPRLPRLPRPLKPLFPPPSRPPFPPMATTPDRQPKAEAPCPLMRSPLLPLLPASPSPAQCCWRSEWPSSSCKRALEVFSWHIGAGSEKINDTFHMCVLASLLAASGFSGWE